VPGLQNPVSYVVVKLMNPWFIYEQGTCKFRSVASGTAEDSFENIMEVKQQGSWEVEKKFRCLEKFK
jgi:hypothetical protein